ADASGIRGANGDARARVRGADGRVPVYGRGEGRERPDLPRREIALSHLPLWRGRALALQIREQRRVHSRRIDQAHSSFPDGWNPERRSSGGASGNGIVTRLRMRSMEVVGDHHKRSGWI